MEKDNKIKNINSIPQGKVKGFSFNREVGFSFAPNPKAPDEPSISSEDLAPTSNDGDTCTDEVFTNQEEKEVLNENTDL